MPKTKTSKRQPVARRPVALLVTVLCLALLLALLLLWAIASQTGFFLRHTTVIRCGGETVDGAMFAVYYKETLITLTAGVEDYDPDTSSTAQAHPGGGTWHDYVLAETKQAVTRMAVLAAVAADEGQDAIAAHQAAEEYMDALNAAAPRGKEAYITARYGQGVRESDVYRAAALYARAAARATALAETTYTAEEREAAYAANASAFALADYIAYPVKVDIAGITDPDEMRQAYAAAEARAQSIAAAGDEGDFLDRLQADMQGADGTLTTTEMQKKIAALYRTYVPADTAGLAAAWATDPARQTGDTAVLGATGDYTVVYCLSPAGKREDRTANAWQIVIPFADHMDIAATFAAAQERLDALTSTEAFATDPAATYLSAADFVGIERAVADWLAADHPAGATAIRLTKAGYAILCYVSPSPYAAWEWQAITALQEAEYAAMQAAYPARVKGAVDLPQAALLSSTQ